ncbi:hypothetical protein V7024_24060 [Bacillus sp. JJ864]|uniref:hypothetical protein n=1 Tax=Bacillus sp. JJ864 TaxID=3122975 RepID=UPI0030004A35
MLIGLKDHGIRTNMFVIVYKKDSAVRDIEVVSSLFRIATRIPLSLARQNQLHSNSAINTFAC